MPPSVLDLVVQDVAFLFVELCNTLDTARVLCNQSTLPEKRQNVGQVVLIRKEVDVLEKLMFGNAKRGFLILRSLARGNVAW